MSEVETEEVYENPNTWGLIEDAVTFCENKIKGNGELTVREKKFYDYFVKTCANSCACCDVSYPSNMKEYHKLDELRVNMVS